MIENFTPLRKFGASTACEIMLFWPEVCLHTCPLAGAGALHYLEFRSETVHVRLFPAQAIRSMFMWEFPKLGVPYFGILTIRILLFRVLC